MPKLTRGLARVQASMASRSNANYITIPTPANAASFGIPLSLPPLLLSPPPPPPPSLSSLFCPAIRQRSCRHRKPGEGCPAAAATTTPTWAPSSTYRIGGPANPTNFGSQTAQASLPLWSTAAATAFAVSRASGQVNRRGGTPAGPCHHCHGRTRRQLLPPGGLTVRASFGGHMFRRREAAVVGGSATLSLSEYATRPRQRARQVSATSRARPNHSAAAQFSSRTISPSCFPARPSSRKRHWRAPRGPRPFSSSRPGSIGSARPPVMMSLNR